MTRPTEAITSTSTGPIPSKDLPSAEGVKQAELSTPPTEAQRVYLEALRDIPIDKRSPIQGGADLYTQCKLKSWVDWCWPQGRAFITPAGRKALEESNQTPNAQ